MAGQRGATWARGVGLVVALVLVTSLVGAGPSEALTPAVAAPTRYVALGDAFSSGEGNPPYQPATDTTTDRCHRSLTRAYPDLLAINSKLNGAALTFVACSGALVPDLVGTAAAKTGQWGEFPQIGALLASGKPDPSVTVVTLSIGASDFGFVPDLSACLSGAHHPEGKCQSSSETRYNNAVLELAVGGGYTVSTKGVGWLTSNRVPVPCNVEVARCIETPSMIELFQEIAHDAPNAAIRVLGYPQLFPANPSRSCTVGQFSSTESFQISKSDMIFLNKLTSEADTVISNHVTVAKFIGVPNIRFVPTVNAFHGHSFCSGTPWFNRLTWTSKTNLSSDSASSFHPNAAGQQRFEQLIAATL